ncbi:hypothetical protein TRVL_07126 [Trypanosoma vivax]|nr:hypothetical protein TRVL_07126 [Trypanosoma vivax]
MSSHRQSAAVENTPAPEPATYKRCRSLVVRSFHSLSMRTWRGPARVHTPDIIRASHVKSTAQRSEVPLKKRLKHTVGKKQSPEYRHTKTHGHDELRHEASAPRGEKKTQLCHNLTWYT